MVTYKFIYSDKSFIIKKFQSTKEAMWFAFNEGDHLLEYKRLSARI